MAMVHCTIVGLFMALQPRIIACGTKMAAIGMAIKFIGGPLVMSAASVVVGLRGVQLHTAIVQVTNCIIKGDLRRVSQHEISFFFFGSIFLLNNMVQDLGHTDFPLIHDDMGRIKSYLYLVLRTSN